MAECHCGTCEHCVVPMRQEMRAATEALVGPIAGRNVDLRMALRACVDAMRASGHVDTRDPSNDNWHEALSHAEALLK